MISAKEKALKAVEEALDAYAAARVAERSAPAAAYSPRLGDVVTVSGCSVFAQVWLGAVGRVVRGTYNYFAVEVQYAPNHPRFDPTKEPRSRRCALSNPDSDVRLATEAERATALLAAERPAAATLDAAVDAHFKRAAAAAASTLEPRRTKGAVVELRGNHYAVIENGAAGLPQRVLRGHAKDGGILSRAEPGDRFVRWMTAEECKRHGIPYVPRDTEALETLLLNAVASVENDLWVGRSATVRRRIVVDAVLPVINEWLAGRAGGAK